MISRQTLVRLYHDFTIIGLSVEKFIKIE